MNAITSFFGCEINKSTSTPSHAERLATLQIMKPKPSPYPLIRIGGMGDGAYLVPDDLAGITACFSPGVNNTKDFEDQLTDEYGIACHMCDKSSDPEKFRTPLKNGLQTFRKSWLDVTGSDDCVSLENWVRDLSPNPADDLLLQIDIEGAEYRNFLQHPLPRSNASESSSWNSTPWKKSWIRMSSASSSSPCSQNWIRCSSACMPIQIIAAATSKFPIQT